MSAMNIPFEADRSFPSFLTLSWAWEQSLDDPAAVKAALARNLRRLRDSRRLTQKALAKSADVGLLAIRDIEAGRGLPTIGVLLRLADTLGVSCGELVSPAAPSIPKAARRAANARIPQGALT
jgi:DNA-binding XRE family transcriptional regulator